MVEKNFSHEIAKGGIIAILGMSFGRLVIYLFNLLTARLGTTEYGVLSLGIVIITFLSLLSLLGLRMGVIRYVSYYLEQKDLSRAKGAFTSSLIIAFPVSIITSVLLFFSSEFISINLFHTALLIPVLRILSFTLPFAVYIALVVGSLRGLKEISYSVFIKEFLQVFLLFSFALFFIHLGYGILGVALAYLISVVFTAFFAFFVFKKKTCFLPSSIFYPRKLFFFSLPLVFIGFLPLFIKWTDVFVLGIFRTTHEVGIYTSASITSNLMLIVPLALTSLFMPIVTRLHSSGKEQEISYVSRLTSRWIFIINFPLFLIVVLFSKEILLLLFGKEYVLGSLSLIILSLGSLFFSLSQVHLELLSSINKTRVVFLLASFTILLDILFNLFFIPRFGMAGGAISTLSALFLLYLFSLILTYALVRITSFSSKLFKTLLAGLFSFLLIYLLRYFVPSSSFSLLFFFGFLFLFAYLLFLFLLRCLEHEDLDIFRSILHRLRKLLKT